MHDDWLIGERPKEKSPEDFRPLTKADLKTGVSSWEVLEGIVKLALYGGAAWLAWWIYERATIKSLLGAILFLLVGLLFRGARR